MNFEVMFAKIARRWTRSTGKGRNLLRGGLRKVFVDQELVSATQGGFLMYASPNNYASYGIFFYGIYDPHMTSFFQGQVFEGAYCWDIGTERGWFTLLMAKLVGPGGRVDAFEPFPDNFQRLQANIRLNHFEQVYPQQVAISSQIGETSFVLPEHGLTTNADFLEGCTGVGYLAKDGHSGSDTIRVATTTIDHQMELQKLPRMDFIKIDVEGAEMDVLRGGEQSIRKHRPVIAIEYNELALQRAGASIRELDQLLDSFGYDRFVFEGSLKRYRPELWEKYPVENQVYNVYCLPRESTR